MQPIRRILFPTDFSEHADSAWLYALQFGQQFGADVHLLHVVSPPPHMGEAYLGNFDSRKYEQALTSAANDSDGSPDRSGQGPSIDFPLRGPGGRGLPGDL